MRKDFTSVLDLNREEIREVLGLAFEFKRKLRTLEEHKYLKDKTLAMLFEKPSLRTRVTFESGMTQLGGHAIYLAPSDIGMGKRESISDVARNLSRWVHGILARTFAHSTVKELAKNSSVPVINALSDLEHPCQALADFQTICELKAAGTTRLAGLKLAYLGDGNNVCHSLLLASALLDVDMVVACPMGYEPEELILNAAESRANRSTLEVVNDPEQAARDADVVYTDVWTSMGQEEEREKRLKLFEDFQVTEAMMGLAKKDAIFMHCMPVHRGEEVAAEVIDGPQSAVFEQAENRLHSQKAIMVELMR
ncbi:MAG: ornithine carbamoyltransferase [bacterium]